jgi:folate-binding protein YgfZ
METTVHNAEPTSSALAVHDLSTMRSQFRALVSGSGVYQSSTRARIKLSGEDRVRWLNGMVTNNIRDLAVNHGIYAFLLNPQGRILGDLHAYNLGNSLLLETEQSQLTKILEIFDHYIIMDDVVVEDISSTFATVGIDGPKSKATLETVGLNVADLQPLEAYDAEWRGSKLTVVRQEHESYEIWVSPESATNLFHALRDAGGTSVDPATLELFRISLGVPSYGQDIRERDLPQETEQARALNFNKGCYVGQEIVERIRSRGAVHRMFTGFLVDGVLPLAGTKIQVEGKDVGEITSSAALPADDGERNVALGYIRREVAIQSKEILAGATKLAIAKLPFQFIFG